MRVIIATSVLALAGAFGLAACSNDTGDYKSGTEDFIEGEMSDQVEEQLGEREEWSDAECEEPDSTDAGTEYTCTAIDSHDQEWKFTAEIDGEDSFQIVASEAPGAPGTGSSTPGGGSAPGQPTATTASD